MREVKLPAIPSGPMAGRMPEVGMIIDPTLSPGLDKVVPNLRIRPPSEDETQTSDVEMAAAKHLAEELTYAGVIETTTRDRILKEIALTRSAPPAEGGGPEEK